MQSSPAVAQQDAFDQVFPDCGGSEQSAEALLQGCFIQLLVLLYMPLLDLSQSKHPSYLCSAGRDQCSVGRNSCSAGRNQCSAGVLSAVQGAVSAVQGAVSAVQDQMECTAAF